MNDSEIGGELSEVLGLIADQFEFSRCKHVKETGLAEFAEEVRVELMSAS
jgi:hypothetical protein